MEGSDRSHETRLVTRARSGDRRAMEELYRVHAGRVYTVVRRVVGDDHLAEDVSQDAWIRAFEKLHLFRGDAAFGTWMHRLAVNAALNQLRQRGRRAELEAEAEIKTSEPAKDDAVLNQRLLALGLDKLSEGYRTVLVLHDVEGLTHEEIGEKLGIAAGTSKSQLHKARARMRSLIAPQTDGARKTDEAENHV